MKMRKKLIFLIVLLFGAAGLFACGKISGNVMGKADATAESEGYESPEHAVAAYIEGLKENDLNQMVSTFAIEQYVDNFDLHSYLEWMQAYQLQQAQWPAANDITRDLNIEKRKSEIINYIRYQYLALNKISANFNEPQILKTESEQKKFLEQLTGQLASMDFSSIKLNGFIPPESANELYGSEANGENLARTAAEYGANQIVSRMAVIEIGENQYALCFDTVEYDGKWYNLQLGGNLSLLLGIEIMSSGTIPLDIAPEYREEWESLIVPME